MKMKCRCSFFVVLGLVLYFGVSWLFMWPPVVHEARPVSARNACIDNLRLIEMAKEQWAAKGDHSNRTPVVIEEVNRWLKGGQTPICPSGGTYAYGRVGEKPTCSLGESIPKKIRVSAFTHEWSPSKDHRMNPW